MNLIPVPVIDFISLAVGTNGGFSFSFSGFTNASYRVWASTNLATWITLGSATSSVSGVFNFSDTATTNWAQRFYRVTSP